MTNDPTRVDYVPAYEDEGQEYRRLVRCLQQQIEDCFTTIHRIQETSVAHPSWRTLREGLRCWRAAIRNLTVNP